jgi:hypothetical protein
VTVIPTLIFANILAAFSNWKHADTFRLANVLGGFGLVVFGTGIWPYLLNCTEVFDIDRNLSTFNLRLHFALLSLAYSALTAIFVAKFSPEPV